MKYLLFILTAFSTFAATVTGPVQDARGYPLKVPITFTPSAPQAVKSVTTGDVPIYVPVTNGMFSTPLIAGLYRVTWPGETRALDVVIPDSELTFRLDEVVWNIRQIGVTNFFSYSITNPAPVILDWVGETDGNSYHSAVTLVDGVPCLTTKIGAGTEGPLEWVGPSDGNDYELVLTLVDGVRVTTLRKL